MFYGLIDESGRLYDPNDKILVLGLIVTIADFVAGAIRLSYTKNNLRFKEEIKDLIVEEKVTTWVDLKRISNP